MSDSWKTSIAIDDRLTVGQVNSIARQLSAQRGVDYRTNLGKQLIHLIISPEHFWLSYNAPPGSHEFARGWVLYGVAFTLARMAKQSLDFQRIEWSKDSRRQLKAEDDGIRIHQDGSFEYLVGFKEGNISVKVPPHPTEIAA